MKILRKLFGLDFPDPEVGQIWRSRHSGRCMRVSRVHVTDCGTVMVLVEFEADCPGGWTLGVSYAICPADWRRSLREEARELVFDPSNRGHVPPRPMPAPAPHPKGDLEMELAANVARLRRDLDKTRMAATRSMNYE